MPLLLPGMFWLLFVERELCLTDDDKWHKSTTRSNPITCTVSSRKRGVCVLAFWRRDGPSLISQKPIVKLLTYALHSWNLF